MKGTRAIMTTHKYIELRSQPAKMTSTVAADIARHLQARQYLGATVVICEYPHSMLSAIRKQWLRMARNLQKQRASTLNAEEILRFTHTIMHMQHVQFTSKPPTPTDSAQIFCLTPNQLKAMPHNCSSIYVTIPLSTSTLQHVAACMAQYGLMINYGTDFPYKPLGLIAKKHLEARIQEEWQHLKAFLQQHGIDPAKLVHGGTLQFEPMDEALDILLNTASEFLRNAANFQHTINLAQPITDVEAQQRRQFEAIMRLAHRVQSLSPTNFGGYLNYTFGDHDLSSYFLRDAAPEDDTALEQDDTRQYIFAEYS